MLTRLNLPLCVSMALSTLAWGAANSPQPAADSRRGAELLRTQGCSNCHVLDGSGSSKAGAPDLTRRTAREYSAAGMASRMWNHAPGMWTAMIKEEVSLPKITEGDAADLLAFFYAARFFESPGDAGRGKAVFNEKGCAGCHGLTAGAAGSAKPVSKWESLVDPIQLVQRMWTHSADMRNAVQQKKLKWPTLSGQDLTDLLVYVQNLPANRNLPYHFVLPRAVEGKKLIEAKNCNSCHSGQMALETRIVGKSLTDVAAAMWNHSPRMTPTVPAVSSDEIRQIVIDLWGTQFLNPTGDRARGQKVYEMKCNVCHGRGQAPVIPPGQTVATMVSNLWIHGPKMLAKIQKTGGEWPHLSALDMANLITYLNGKR